MTNKEYVISVFNKYYAPIGCSSFIMSVIIFILSCKFNTNAIAILGFIFGFMGVACSIMYIIYGVIVVDDWLNQEHKDNKE